ncbi:serine/threonine-protein kinase BLUS1 isoform X3 [Sorghum bicolor]|uniref:serine/threonine-protein kinase BLUS1 isoform X3 n=1 Tax=Sorghum bicolor TaxID=4558 RepID=UPI000B425281|nr:serine/threonine-protein kinase BLUS1 isoform X3 [Sorghum bicolor]|eukprot:XP_021305186.1 serine/threonine-protein kinase BLUS1 isoform X3 [Sorghum bicolor]
MEHALISRRFPTDPNEYKLYEEIGEGVSATVYRALCVPVDILVAIKVLDLEKCNNDLDGIRREVQTMSLIDHPNLLRAYCSFTNGHQLWVVMPYMAAGSALHIMKTSFPEGFDEPVIATLLREVLKALVYLHSEGHIHRDVKAGNILIDTNGAVKLADFGVSACMFDTGNRQRARNTFVGTPCWMAPEVMQQLHGYDYKADIWSFGITALELAHGHAPFSKYPPMKVLLMTLQNAPPGLDYERDKRFSKSFKDLVATCLVKDPRKRPPSEKLLKHSFFKHARSAEYLARSILDGLPPLGERFRELKCKEAELLLNNKLGQESKEQLSQKEYIRGISGWNFNLEDLKNAAALIDNLNGTCHLDVRENKVKDDSQDAYNGPGHIYQERLNHVASRRPEEDEIQEVEALNNALSSSFPNHPLEALKSCFDVCGADDLDPTATDSRAQPSVRTLPFQQLQKMEHCKSANCNGESLERSLSVPKNLVTSGYHRHSSGSLIPEQVLSPYSSSDLERDGFRQKNLSSRNRSGPLLFRQLKDSRTHQSAHPFLRAVAPEESSEGNIIRRRGRFQVTSDSISQKVATSACSSSSRINLPIEAAQSNPKSPAILPTLQFLMQQNTMQKEVLSRLISSIEETSDDSLARTSSSYQSSGGPAREKELHSYVLQLQRSVTELAEEVQRLKLQNNQLEQQINVLSRKDERSQTQDNRQ